MSLPILVRKMLASESAMVLSNWKNQLNSERTEHGWSNGLNRDCFWDLVNHVVDKISLPTSEVFVACYESEPATPLCWVAVRKIPGLSTYDVVYLYARYEIRRDPVLAVTLERELLSEVQKQRPLASQRRPFSPFKELRR